MGDVRAPVAKPLPTVSQGKQNQSDGGGGGQRDFSLKSPLLRLAVRGAFGWQTEARMPMAALLVKAGRRRELAVGGTGGIRVTRSGRRSVGCVRPK